jgi:hypothetical protein
MQLHNYSSADVSSAFHQPLRQEEEAKDPYIVLADVRAMLYRIHTSAFDCGCDARCQFYHSPRTFDPRTGPMITLLRAVDNHVVSNSRPNCVKVSV